MPNRYLTHHRPVYQYLVCHLIVPINVLKIVDCTVGQSSFRQVYTDPLSLENRVSLPDDFRFQSRVTIIRLLNLSVPKPPFLDHIRLVCR